MGVHQLAVAVVAVVVVEVLYPVGEAGADLPQKPTTVTLRPATLEVRVVVVVVMVVLMAMVVVLSVM